MSQTEAARGARAGGRFFEPRFCKLWLRTSVPRKCSALPLQEAMLDAEAEFQRDHPNTPGLAGPLQIAQQGQALDLDRLGTGSFLLPRNVEANRVAFRRCRATGILAVEKWSVAYHLIESGLARSHRLLIACTDGVPRHNMRRFLHRATSELQLPVYLVTDNDSWGYFTFAVLRRGAILPHQRIKSCQIDEVRFLGLRAGDLECLPESCRSSFVLPAGVSFADELRCLRQYPCFRNRRWQRELDRFEAQTGTLELEALTAVRGPAWVAQFLTDRIAAKQWLT